MRQIQTMLAGAAIAALGIMCVSAIPVGPILFWRDGFGCHQVIRNPEDLLPTYVHSSPIDGICAAG